MNGNQATIEIRNTLKKAHQKIITKQYTDADKYVLDALEMVFKGQVSGTAIQRNRQHPSH